MDALQFNKAVSQHCKESGGDCCKCDLRHVGACKCIIGRGERKYNRLNKNRIKR